MGSYVENNLLERVNKIPSTKVKRYPDGMFIIFKTRFCMREDFQKEEVDYTEPYDIKRVDSQDNVTDIFTKGL